MEEKELIDEMIMEKLIQCFSVFGLEGTEDAIIKNLGGTLKERFLEIYHNLLWRK